MLKLQSILEGMHSGDTNVHAHNWLGKYESRQDRLENLFWQVLLPTMSTKKQKKMLILKIF